MILATNTSALSVAAIAEATRRPDRVIGLHFFNPAPIMPLVEVVAPPLADPAVVARAVEIITAWGKTPVVCADRPGFIVNRVNRPFTIEALRILEAGAASVDRDRRGAARRRLPDGPVRADGSHRDRRQPRGRDGVWEGLGRPDRLRPSPIQEALVAAGDLGRKTGQGFYRYEDGRRTGEAGDQRHPPRARASNQTQIRDRILDAIAAEAQLAATEGVASPDVIDLALRLGAGHPRGPFESRSLPS